MFNPLNWFKKKEKTPMPSKFYLIKRIKQAKELGLDDEETKIVEIYKDGKLAELPQPYTEELIMSLREVDEIPGTEEIFNEEEYDFIEIADFGAVKWVR